MYAGTKKQRLIGNIGKTIAVTAQHTRTHTFIGT